MSAADQIDDVHDMIVVGAGFSGLVMSGVGYQGLNIAAAAVARGIDLRTPASR